MFGTETFSSGENNQLKVENIKNEEQPEACRLQGLGLVLVPVLVKPSLSEVSVQN